MPWRVVPKAALPVGDAVANLCNVPVGERDPEMPVERAAEAELRECVLGDPSVSEEPIGLSWI